MTKVEIYRDGELYLVQRDGYYHIHGTWKGGRVRKSCQTKNLREAKQVLDNLRREHLSGWRPDYDDPDVDWLTIAAAVHKRHRNSASERGIPFDLEPIAIFHLMKATGFRCALSGIAFSKQITVGGGWRDPWAPSIDRIENRHGYVPENIRIVSLIANTAMNAWGYDTLLRLANGIVRSSFVVADELARQKHAEEDNFAQVIEFKREEKM